MRLPNAQAAEIATEKIAGYLLSDSHPVGRFKARFFRSLGFRREDVEDLRAALLLIAAEGDAREIEAPAGRKFVVDGWITGRWHSAAVRTVWLIEEDRPRFVTAYPL